ncbi:hypothetical protein RJ639_046211 [Escallonia herrerae]|uniref:Chalcone/stilbene synthase N-terminal domain-containing protein n=1 Tax=Escallonia herrerae TaxID=1293975 RepID=A0AA89B0G8_9ASTE|nr:hypothetical protein RJ639_046211 [Escallonia herrerae]
MQKSSPVRLGQHLQPVPHSSQRSPFLHGPIPRRPSGHGGHQNPQARQGSRRQGQPSRSGASLSPRSLILSRLLHQLRRQHARRRPTAHQAPRPPPLRLQGYFTGGTILCLAKDLAENNAGARFLVVYSEITAVIFYGPFDTHLNSLIGQALFSDGAVAVTEGKQISGEIELEMANTESKFLKHKVIYITHLVQN